MLTEEACPTNLRLSSWQIEDLLKVWSSLPDDVPRPETLIMEGHNHFSPAMVSHSLIPHSLLPLHPDMLAYLTCSIYYLSSGTRARRTGRCMDRVNGGVDQEDGRLVKQEACKL
jgi:hypothetical protein